MTMTFRKIHRGKTQRDVFVDKGRDADAPTVRISHDPAFRKEYDGVVEFDLERIDAVVMALINLKADLTELKK